MKQEEKSIYNFKKGDIITRIKPVLDEMGNKDYTLVGKRVTFKGIANASVYLSREADFLTSIFVGKDNFTIQVPLELYELGWADYIEPDFIDEDSPIFDDEKSLHDEIQKAVKEDNYERADMLKKRLEELKNKKKGDK